ncbi:MAG TPA: hypothetical protein VFZ25_19030 [Chloroflexota bacterium]|nr:hypothetical protein [Chloroflexota bacterium]
MIRHCLTTGHHDLTPFDGAALARDVIVPAGGTIRRGAILDSALRTRLDAAPGLTVVVVIAEPDEIAQGEASRRVAAALVGPGAHAEPPHQGQVIVRAATTGLARIAPETVEAVNRAGSILLATSLDGRIVKPDDVLAVVKAARLWVSEKDVADALAVIPAEPAFRVAPFTVREAAFIAGQRIRPANFDLAVPNLEAALTRRGAHLAATEHLTDQPAEILAAYRRQIERGAGVILVAGSILLDPGDPYVVAVEELGGQITCQGAPIDPGTMFWVGEVGDTVFLGLASCELYGRLSILDLILPYALAQEPITPALFAQLGYGGLLEQTAAARR